MDRFVHASGAGDDWRTAVDACIRRTGPAEGAANLGFVYVTDLLAGDLPSVLDRLKAGTGIEHWVGTVGMGICGTAAEFYDVPAISVLLCRFPEESFRIFSAAGADVEADALGAPPSPHQTPFGIVHGDPRATGLAELIDSLSRCMGNAFLVGGLTSSRDRFLSVADTVVEKPLSGVFFSDSVAVATRLTQGCSPLGQRHLVTHCDENLIYALDNTPATEVLRQDIGPEVPDDWHQIARLVFAGLPVKGSDTGDYLVRNIVGVDARHGVLAIADVVAPGDSLIFCTRDARTAREDLVRMLTDIRQPRPARGAVYFSCIARGRSQFGPDSVELGIIRDVLGDVPLAGFFGNGEISHTRLYGYTGVLTLFL